MYDRILVPLKGDATDEAVVAHTGSLARLSGGKVTLLRVIHTHSRDEATFMEREASRYLEEKIVRLKAAGVHAEARVMSGEPVEAIVAAARALDADLIIMATHGHREVRHVLVGSVTEGVVRNSPTPVLLVRP
jgi:nucleotide-binding universal stress UspA family protein